MMTERSLILYFRANYLSFERKVNFLCDSVQRGNLRASYTFVEEKEYAHTHKDIPPSCERFYLAEKARLREPRMNSREMLLRSFSPCRRFGVTSDAPHAVFEHRPPRDEPRPANPAATAHLLVPRRSTHPLLLPPLSADGVHGEPQPRPAQNDPEQRTVCTAANCW